MFRNSNLITGHEGPIINYRDRKSSAMISSISNLNNTNEIDNGGGGGAGRQSLISESDINKKRF